MNKGGRQRRDMMFFKRKQPIIPDIPFDPETQKPVIRCSICNGEQIAGFKDKKTGKFTEVLLVFFVD